MSEVRVEVEGRTLTLSNLDKVLYPSTGTTKGEVLHYYASIAPVLLPQLRDRAVTRIRWPHGVAQGSFFEKNVPARTPSWVRTATVPTTGSRTASKEEGTLTFPIVDDLATLTWLVNLAALELHVHQWRVGPSTSSGNGGGTSSGNGGGTSSGNGGEPMGADRIVIDLDPGQPAGLHECARVALLARGLLADRDLAATPVLSGSKGLHLYATLPEPVTSEESSALAKEVAEQLQRQQPSLVTATMTKSRRTGKVFLDWSQNAGSKTTICPYSLRGRELPTVAAPVTWAEVAQAAEDPLALEQLRFEEVLERVQDFGDLFGSED